MCLSQELFSFQYALEGPHIQMYATIILWSITNFLLISGPLPIRHLHLFLFLADNKLHGIENNFGVETWGDGHHMVFPSFICGN